jgi:hypothetical protein
MCQTPTPNEFAQHNLDTIQPTGGLHVSIHTGYNMFNDVMDQDEIDDLMSVVLCHNCSVKFIDMFPPNFQHLFRVGHPNTMCGDSYKEKGCNYSWNPKDYGLDEQST